uniref:Uncharacterized protein n=1 Tax=Rhizophora mucronata TaxID=61149 RepID=A0A2P2PB25_RHIMU
MVVSTVLGGLIVMERQSRTLYCVSKLCCLHDISSHPQLTSLCRVRKLSSSVTLGIVTQNRIQTSKPSVLQKYQRRSLILVISSLDVKSEPHCDTHHVSVACFQFFPHFWNLCWSRWILGCWPVVIFNVQ